MGKFFRSLTLTMVLLSATFVFYLQMSVRIPITITTNETTMKKLQYVGVNSTEIAKAVKIASDQTNISEEFIIALVFTESSGDVHAVSCKGYNGLMQIPQKVFYPDANVIIGSRIFLEKMKIANNNVEKAIILYKGYEIGSKRGREQAKKVLVIYD